MGMRTLWHRDDLLTPKTKGEHKARPVESWSGRRDLNSRPLDPQSSALTKLGHAPMNACGCRGAPFGAPPRCAGPSAARPTDGTTILAHERGAVKTKPYPETSRRARRVAVRRRGRLHSTAGDGVWVFAIRLLPLAAKSALNSVVPPARIAAPPKPDPWLHGRGDWHVFEPILLALIEAATSPSPQVPLRQEVTSQTAFA